MKGIFRSNWLSMIRKWIALVVISTFTLSPSTTYAQTVLDLPAPGAMVLQSPAFVPVVLRAIKIRPDEPLVFDFVVDNGNTGFEGAALKNEIEKIAKYFLATLTIPQKDLWVNLSPYEKDRIIPDELGQTEMGRDMLAQDYILKQLSSSLVNPDSALGKEFWQRLYAKAQETLGTTEIPMDTFNKVWIVPEKAVIYEKDNAAVLGETHLKLMMEEDYLAQRQAAVSDDWAANVNRSASDADKAGAQVSSQIMREVVLPEIEKEVNTGKNFAPLRQMFSAMILATWYKEAVKDSLLAQMYEDKKKISGVDIQDVNMREKIFDQYVAAYKKGVFNFIRDDKDPVSGDVLPRKYFSGGVSASAMAVERQPMIGQSGAPASFKADGNLFAATIGAGKPAKKAPGAPKKAMGQDAAPGKWVANKTLVSGKVSDVLSWLREEKTRISVQADKDWRENQSEIENSRLMAMEHMEAQLNAEKETNRGKLVTGADGNTLSWQSSEKAMEQNNPEWDALLNRPKLTATEQLEEDVQAYGPLVKGYWEGTEGTTPYPHPIRPAVKEDIEVIPEMDEALALQDEQSGAEAVRSGILGFINLEAGASSRMNVKEAPPEVIKMNGGRSFNSKAAVPVGEYNGEVVTYQDYFMHDVAGLLRDVGKEARSAGKPDNTANNRVIILSNDEYLPEQVELTKRHNSYGLPAENIDFVLQPLAPTFQARPKDVEAMREKYKFSDDEFQRRMAAAKLAEEKFQAGDVGALFIDGDRQPGGHGELDHQLIASGEILRLLDKGIKILSVRNTDNKGGRFNQQFLRAVGAFLRNNRDFQMEFNRRAGQVGGDLVIRTDNNGKVLLEQPTLKATKGADGKPVVEPGTSYWFNSACGLMSVRYLLSLYIDHKEGQNTDQDIDDLIKELRAATPAERQAIAARGRSRAQKIFDAKPSKTDPNKTVVKSETNHWQLSNNVPDDVKVGAVGVWNMVDLILNISFRDIAKMSWEKLKKYIGAARFFSAKQWTLSAAKIQEARDLLTKALGRVPDDAELMPTLETYVGNKDFVGYFLKDLFEEPHVTPGIFNPSASRGTPAQEAGVYDLRNPDTARKLLDDAQGGKITYILFKPDWNPQEQEKFEQGLADKGYKIAGRLLPFRMTAQQAEDFYPGHRGRKGPDGLEYADRMYAHLSQDSGWKGGLVLERGTRTGPIELDSKQKTELRNLLANADGKNSEQSRFHSPGAVDPKETNTVVGDTEKLIKIVNSPNNATLPDGGSAPAEKAMNKLTEQPKAAADGGIDFYNAMQGMQVERTGNGIKVHVDPAEIQRIQTGGFDGFAPVVIDVIQVHGILPALGMAEPQGAENS